MESNRTNMEGDKERLEAQVKYLNERLHELLDDVERLEGEKRALRSTVEQLRDTLTGYREAHELIKEQMAKILKMLEKVNAHKEAAQCFVIRFLQEAHRLVDLDPELAGYKPLAQDIARAEYDLPAEAGVTTALQAHQRTIAAHWAQITRLRTENTTLKTALDEARVTVETDRDRCTAPSPAGGLRCELTAGHEGHHEIVLIGGDPPDVHQW